MAVVSGPLLVLDAGSCDAGQGAGVLMAKRKVRALKRTPSTRRRKGVPSLRAPRSGERATELALAAFAHDVRTPLTGILAIGELLATSELDERERHWVTTL